MNIGKIGQTRINSNINGISKSTGQKTAKETPAGDDEVILSGNSYKQEPGKTNTPAKKTDENTSEADGHQTDYHFKPSSPVFQENGRWYMQLPNAKIAMPGKPAWLESIEKMNKILDESPNPRQLKEHTDNIKNIADKSYMEEGQRFDPVRINAYVEKIDDGRMISDLTKIFQIRLDDETKSTHQVGGTMAGSLCSEMTKYGHIMSALKKA